jgi:hypothetical protein
VTERQQQYWALLQQGYSISEVARACGVSKQAVHQATVGYEEQLVRVRRHARRSAERPRILKYKCSICGSRLHTKARHGK